MVEQLRDTDACLLDVVYKRTDLGVISWTTLLYLGFGYGLIQNPFYLSHLIGFQFSEFVTHKNNTVNHNKECIFVFSKQPHSVWTAARL